MTSKTILSSLGRLFGLRSRSQSATYLELMNLTDRQLEDIGLTRGLIEDVVVQGPQSIRHLLPDGAVQAAANANANANRPAGATVA